MKQTLDNMEAFVKQHGYEYLRFDDRIAIVIPWVMTDGTIGESVEECTNMRTLRTAMGY